MSNEILDYVDIYYFPTNRTYGILEEKAPVPQATSTSPFFICRMQDVKLKNNFLHCEDGPAGIMDGSPEWSLNGKSLIYREWVSQVCLSDEQLIMLKLIYNESV